MEIVKSNITRYDTMTAYTNEIIHLDEIRNNAPKRELEMKVNSFV